MSAPDKTMVHRLTTLCLAASAVLTIGLVPTTAFAGSAEDDARKLFEEGTSAERAGRREEACAKFRQSLGFVREIGPLSKVKDCDAREGKLVSAEATLAELVVRWPQPGPELDALKAELAALQRRIPHLTLKVRSDAPLDVSVRLDGKPIDFPSDRRALDPGKHELLVDVPNRPVDRIAIELKEGEQKILELPNSAPEAPKPPPPPVASSAGLGPLGIVGIVVGAVGVGGFVGAGVTGKLVLDKESEFEAGHCGAEDPLPDAANCPTIAGDGDSLLIANGVLWGVGIAGVAVGATLLVVDLVSSSSEPSAPAATLGVRPGRAELTIRF